MLEAELVHRARLLEANDAPDFATHRRAYPDDPLPALVLVADGVSLERAGRLAAILAQGTSLGVGALLPGTTVGGGAQLALDETGRVQSATPRALGDQQLAGARLRPHPDRGGRAAAGAGPFQNRRRRRRRR